MRFFLFFYKDKNRRSFINRLPNPTTMRRGFRILTRSYEFTSLYFRLYGIYEIRSIKFLIEEINGQNEATTFLDIGANLGIFSLDIAKHTNAAVIAFEPNPITAECLRRSIALNDLTERIQVEEVAVGERSSRLQFIDNSENSGDSALLQGRNSFKPGEVLSVRVISIDQDKALQEQLAALPQVKTIKMDIQGAELLALQGMKNFLLENRPVLLIEIAEDSLKEFGSSTAELISLLAEFGYRKTDEFDGNAVFRPQ
jgi:FkbM family methyltransferase